MVAPLYLLDTNALSEPLRPNPSARLLSRIEAHRSRLATATVVVHEMVYGLAKLPPSRKKEAIRDYLEGTVLKEMAVFPYDLAAARWHGEVRARMEALGRPLPYRDTQIAAVAKVRGLVLVTANERDFRDLPDLAIENWL